MQSISLSEIIIAFVQKSTRELAWIDQDVNLPILITNKRF